MDDKKIEEILKGQKAVTYSSINKEISIEEEKLKKILSNLEERGDIVIFAERKGEKIWDEIIAWSDSEGIKKGFEKATHVPKLLKIKKWEEFIYELNSISKRIDFVTIDQLIELAGEDPKEELYRLLVARVLRDAGWKPLSNFYGQRVWLSPKLKRDMRMLYEG
jgi:hypothetical protein